jgi:hypothetical protein
MPLVYEESTPKVWSTACLAGYAAGVAWTGASTLPGDPGAFVALSAIYLVVLVPLLGVPISKFVYHRIRLTPSTLRVGRERLAVADLDPAAIGVPPERVAGPLRLVGGAWGVPLGMGTVVVRTRRGEALCIAARDRAGLVAALSGVTAGGPPADPPPADRPPADRP